MRALRAWGGIGRGELQALEIGVPERFSAAHAAHGPQSRPRSDTGPLVFEKRFEPERRAGPAPTPGARAPVFPGPGGHSTAAPRLRPHSAPSIDPPPTP